MSQAMLLFLGFSKELTRCSNWPLYLAQKDPSDLLNIWTGKTSWTPSLNSLIKFALSWEVDAPKNTFLGQAQTEQLTILKKLIR